MDVTDVLRRLRRLRLAVGVVIVAGLVAALVGYVSAASSRQSRSAVVIVPPKVAGVTGGDNPLLNLDNNLAQLAVVLTGALGTETVARALARDGATAEFTISTVTGDNPTFSQLSPQLVFTVTGASDDVTERTAAALVEQSGTALDDLQERAGVPESARASVVEVVAATPPIVVSGGRLRSAGTLGVGVVVLGLLFVLAVDALRRRRSGAAATATTGPGRTPPARNAAAGSTPTAATTPAAEAAPNVSAAEAAPTAPATTALATPVAAASVRKRPAQTFVTRLLAPPAVLPTPVRNTASEAAPPAKRPAKRPAAARETAPLPEIVVTPEPIEADVPADGPVAPKADLDDTLVTGWSSVSLSGEPTDGPAESAAATETPDPADVTDATKTGPDATDPDTTNPDATNPDATDSDTTADATETATARTTETTETDPDTTDPDTTDPDTDATSDGTGATSDTDPDGTDATSDTDPDTSDGGGKVTTKPPAAKTATARKSTRPAGAGNRGGSSSSRRARARKARG